MSRKIKLLGKVKSGELTVCLDCNHYHLTFNNILRIGMKTTPVQELRKTSLYQLYKEI